MSCCDRPQKLQGFVVVVVVFIPGAAFFFSEERIFAIIPFDVCVRHLSNSRHSSISGSHSVHCSSK